MAAENKSDPELQIVQALMGAAGYSKWLSDPGPRAAGEEKTSFCEPP